MTVDYTYYARYASTAAHAYVLVNYTTGEIRCISCEVAHYALRSLYRIYDRELRLAKLYKSAVHMVLANVRTGKVIAEVNRDFAELKLIADLYEEMEG